MAMPESQDPTKKTVDEVLSEAEATEILKKNEDSKKPELKPVTTDINEIQQNLDDEEKKKLEEQREKMKTLSIHLGIDKQTEEIDLIKTQISMIAEKITEIAGVISEQNKTINTLITGTGETTQGTGADMAGVEKLEALTKIADSELGKSIIKKILGSENPTPQQAPLISQEWLNQKMKDSVMENFSLGETILESVKSTLKKKAVQNITQNALQDTGLSHEPA